MGAPLTAATGPTYAMSEYQYYEFQAVDRLFGGREGEGKRGLIRDFP
jgi:hypothetical protein